MNVVQDQAEFSRSASARHYAEMLDTQADEALALEQRRLDDSMMRVRNAQEEREAARKRKEIVLEAARHFKEAEELRAKALMLEALGEEMMARVGIVQQATQDLSMPSLATAIDRNGGEVRSAEAVSEYTPVEIAEMYSAAYKNLDTDSPEQAWRDLHMSVSVELLPSKSGSFSSDIARIWDECDTAMSKAEDIIRGTQLPF